ncbi:hypothetical protein MAPG_05374 [Magnaporthiopsis poae ATCC 64411]|uniref:Uncharacterized protein n=1 Tax=Magnaporthiopsis poae (strain ATCC 64411 / 73-15) TaxID=644358 RepID=A0A0C4DZ82_MAGP6|nr:hypothetical protein MAPG_05374 [Magnaporthiopsis poae ATCC 64411]
MESRTRPAGRDLIAKGTLSPRCCDAFSQAPPARPAKMPTLGKMKAMEHLFAYNNKRSTICFRNGKQYWCAFTYRKSRYYASIRLSLLLTSGVCPPRQCSQQDRSLVRVGTCGRVYAKPCFP